MRRATVGTWAVGGDGGFRFADTDPGGGTYVLTIEGLETDPVRDRSSVRPTSACSGRSNEAAPKLA